MEHGLTRQSIIVVLTRSPHGKLDDFIPTGRDAAAQEPEFLSRLIAWNDKRGSVRDSKVALPVIALANKALAADQELRENAQAHLALLPPRDLLRAVRFGLDRKNPNPQAARVLPDLNQRGMARLVETYLRDREADPKRFERTALTHREALRGLYALMHVKPSPLADQILFKGSKIGVFKIVAGLRDMDPHAAAVAIVKHRIPFLVARGALGKKASDPDLVLALIQTMTPAELVTNTKALMSMGVQTNPALRGAFDAKLAEVSKAPKTKVAALKTAVAAQAMAEAGNDRAADKLAAESERHLESMAVQGDWLVLGDKSGSMQTAIEASRQVAGILARVAKGKVHLTFFDNQPHYNDVTGKTLAEIEQITKRVAAMGGTSIGCGVRQLKEKGITVDGIAVVTDGGETTAPAFATAYREYSDFIGKEVPVYVYLLKGQSPDVMTRNCAGMGIEMSVFDLTGGVDYYSLPNLVATMRTQRYGLVEEIMGTPLLRLADVFKGVAAVETI